MKNFSILCLFALLFAGANVFAQTALQTSFESTGGYSVGNLHNQNGWALTSGTALVSTAKAKTGTQSINLSANAGTLLLNYVAYSGSIPGITGELYADMWVNPTSFVTKGIAINGMDLYGGSSKRIFVIEFGIDGTIKAYNGSSAQNVSTWTSNTWVRISLKVDFATEKYKVAINGSVLATDFTFREAYAPTASGTRVAGIKEFHSLRFNHTADATVATTDAAFDDLYVGTTPIADVSFGASSLIRTITVTQPAYGTIVLSPAAPYTVGQTVTATLTVPGGYMNNGWTGALSGTELVKTILVSENINIGANVGIDIANPPPRYLVSVTQPASGSITLSPASADNMYYGETQVTATVSYDACYQFNGWTGDFTGTTADKVFTIQSNVTIGADITLNTVPAIKRSATTAANFKTALAAMNPGDTVEVENGTYDLSSLTITRSGCALRPIVIKAKNKGMAILNGQTALVFRNMKYVTLQGFAFQSTGVGTGIKLENCSKFRITQNRFALVETSSCTWINIGDTYASPIPIRSGYNRVDHNSFEGKTQAGNFIRMDGNINQQSQYDTIDHNHFKNNGPRADNEKESIRVGVSTLSKSSGFTLIEYNLFEDCDGDPEIVSIKSCDNTIRYNTFVRSLGTLCLRQGFRSTVEGNYFFGDNKTGTYNGNTIGCGGVRVYAKDHKIINNYFSGLTGSKWDAAITITNGDVPNSSTSVADHYLPENLIVAHNTLVNNVSDIEIGFNNNGNYPLSPINCLLTDNIVIENANPIIKVHNPAALGGVAFSNNIMYPTGTSSIGMAATAAQITVADPNLVQPACITPANCTETNANKVLRIASNSPAINAATGSNPSVVLDQELQVRDALKDVGADEYIGIGPIATSFSALDAAHVGPDAITFAFSYTLSTVVPLKLLYFKADRYNSSLAKLTWATTGEEQQLIYEIERSEDGMAFRKIGAVDGIGTTQMHTYDFTDPVPGKAKNFYRIKMVERDGKVSYSPVRSLSLAVAMQVYPNPASEQLIIEIPATANHFQLSLLSPQGQLVRHQLLSTGVVKIPLTGVAAGIYMVKISDGKTQILHERIVVLR